MRTLTRADYAEAGLALLAEGGIGSVTIATTCARLGVTKGSFYHHFRTGREFHAAMLEHWEYLHGSVRPSAISGLPPLERLEAQLVAAQERNHEVESAIRAWSRSDEAAAIVQRRLDDMRLDFTTSTLELCGVPRRRARVLARTALAILVGYQSLGQPVDRRELRAMVDEFRSWVRSVIEEEAAVGTGRRRGGPAA